MYFASVRRVPPVPVLLTLSEPARSTRWSFALRMVSEPGSLELMWIVKMQWERVEAMFIGVYAGGRKEEDDRGKSKEDERRRKKAW